MHICVKNCRNSPTAFILLYSKFLWETEHSFLIALTPYLTLPMNSHLIMKVQVCKLQSSALSWVLMADSLDKDLENVFQTK